MNRRIRLLLGISATVSAAMLLAWVLVQALVIRPSIADREPSRIVQVLDAAEQMRSGKSKHHIEDARGLELRILTGEPTTPPPGDGWIRHETERGTVWKRDGGQYEIAAWTGHVWVVLQEELPVAKTLALALLAGTVPLVILAFGLSQRAHRAQEEAEESLAKIAEGDLSERLDETAGNREGRRVAAAVNRMATQLQVLIESDRKRMAGLSHELRTPLTRIRLELELARREGGPTERLDRVERDIEVFDAMLSEMLELSRLQLVGARSMKLDVVDLAGLAQVVIEEEEHGDVEIRGQGTATIDATMVSHLLRNLLRNSVQHAPLARRWINVADDVLCVGDDGPGIAEHRHARVLEPFQRGEASEGHGLGLAIVMQVASLHGGTVALSQPPGLEVRITFAPVDGA